MHEFKLPITIPISLMNCPNTGLTPLACITLPIMYGVHRAIKHPTMLAVRRRAFNSLRNFLPADCKAGACPWSDSCVSDSYKIHNNDIIFSIVKLRSKVLSQTSQCRKCVSTVLWVKSFQSWIGTLLTMCDSLHCRYCEFLNSHNAIVFEISDSTLA